MSLPNLKYFNLSVKDNVLIIAFDDPEEKVNTLNLKMTDEFHKIMDVIDNDDNIKATVFTSGKVDNFIVGADIKMIKEFKTKEDVVKTSREGHELFKRIENHKKPSVAAINGPCLGGGLEVALSCHYRLATDNSKTILGLPEVMLGLLPGGGGTQRLPKLIGIQKALDMMLTGKNIKPAKAKKMGLIDDVVCPESLETIAVQVAQKLASGTMKIKRWKAKGKDKVLEDNFAGRALVFNQAKSMVLKKTGGLYPAPLKILEAVKAGVNSGSKKGYEAEADLFGDLAMTRESKSLISLFEGQTSLKKNRYGSPENKPDWIGVIGGGLMGSGISLVNIQKGIKTRLKDLSQESLGKSEKYVWGALNKRVKRRAMTSFERDKIFSSLITQTDWSVFERCPLVIEAVFEDLSLKQHILEEFEKIAPEDCVFASNTSALPIKQIAAVSKRPENVLGMHYFSPVEKMPLLEIIVTDKTSDRAASVAVEMGMKQGKTVIVVNDGPGFYTTRILAPLTDEAAIIALEGTDLHHINDIMKDFGFPVGPITLCDEVGLDVAMHIAKDLKKALGERICSAPSELIDDLVKNNMNGRKSGKGFFLYNDKKSSNPLTKIFKGSGKEINPAALKIVRENRIELKGPQSSDEELQKRIAYRMINESALCLQENIIKNPVDGDIGAVFGLGFPPTFGGPFRYLDLVGAQSFLNDMKKFEDRYGERFKVATIIEDYAKENKKFHN